MGNAYEEEQSGILIFLRVRLQGHDYISGSCEGRRDVLTSHGKDPTILQHHQIGRLSRARQSTTMEPCGLRCGPTTRDNIKAYLKEEVSCSIRIRLTDEGIKESLQVGFRCRRCSIIGIGCIRGLLGLHTIRKWPNNYRKTHCWPTSLSDEKFRRVAQLSGGLYIRRLEEAGCPGSCLGY